jgi:hypothetical protein
MNASTRNRAKKIAAQSSRKQNHLACLERGDGILAA